MNKNSLVAIILLNHNKKEDLLECLESVYAQDFKTYEVIVVDNASTDGSGEAVGLKFPSIHLIRNKINLGVAAGRNTGWRRAEEMLNYEFILFLDDDTVIEKSFLTKLVAQFSGNEQIGIACGKTYTNVTSTIIMSAGIYVNLYTGYVYDRGAGKMNKGQFSHPEYIDACGGFGIMVRRDLFVLKGGFDERFSPYGWEDVNLCLQAKKSGYKTYYFPEATMIHKGTKVGRKPSPVYEKSKIKNFLLLMKLNANLLQKICFVFFLPIRAILLTIKLIFEGNAQIIPDHYKGFLQGIRNLILSSKSK